MAQGMALLKHMMVVKFLLNIQTALFDVGFVLGPFCGANSLEGRSFQTTQREILVIFYSDPGFGDRKMGKLRILAHKSMYEAFCKFVNYHLASKLHMVI